MCKNKIFFIMSFFAFFILSSCGKETARTTMDSVKSYALAGENVYPEGITYQVETGNFFVGSTGTGTVYKGHVKSSDTSIFLPGSIDGRTMAVGMKVDKKGRLFIAGGKTGLIFVYDIPTKKLLAKFSSNVKPTFVNDVVITPQGDAFFTDSLNHKIYKVSSSFTQNSGFETWLDWKGSIVQYKKGHNFNGIAISANGKYFICVQSNTGKLFRIEIKTKAIKEIDLNGELLTFGDGIWLEGQILYVLRNRKFLLVTIKLTDDMTKGKIISSLKKVEFDLPTTLARAEKEFLIVNSQFHRRGPGKKAVLPFVVISIPAPGK